MEKEGTMEKGPNDIKVNNSLKDKPTKKQWSSQSFINLFLSLVHLSLSYHLLSSGFSPTELTLYFTLMRESLALIFSSTPEFSFTEIFFEPILLYLILDSFELGFTYTLL